MIATKTKQKIVRSDDFFAAIIAAIDYKVVANNEILLPVVRNNQAAKHSFFEKRAIGQVFAPQTSISHILDAMIAMGAAFDVAEDNFQVVKSEGLTEVERNYLIANEKEVLCTLHQRLLIKHWFYDSPELLEDFAFDIYEFEAILAEAAGLYTYDTYFQSVSHAAQKWFVQLLDLIKQ